MPKFNYSKWYKNRIEKHPPNRVGERRVYQNLKELIREKVGEDIEALEEAKENKP